jgi:hypothetical protein
MQMQCNTINYAIFRIIVQPGPITNISDQSPFAGVQIFYEGGGIPHSGAECDVGTEA